MSIVEPPSYEQLALLVVELTGRLNEATTRLDEAAARIAALEAEVAALQARVGKDSSNSSAPPSADPLAAKAKRKAVTSQRVRSKDRKRGGQVGRQGSGLVPTQDPEGVRNHRRYRPMSHPRTKIRRMFELVEPIATVTFSKAPR